jgi:Photosynthetic reaction centre cytochrome C subunit
MRRMLDEISFNIVAVHSHSQRCCGDTRTTNRDAADVVREHQSATGMSDTDIRMEMNDWTEALGVTCNYCHVAGDFPSDLNPKKETARKMATMVKVINKDFLGGKAKCVLCHRGAAVPNP